MPIILQKQLLLKTKEKLEMPFGHIVIEVKEREKIKMRIPVHNVHFVKYDVTVSFMAQVLDTVAYFVSHVLVVDTVTYFDIFR